MAMTREESAMVGLEIVAYAGDARSKLLMALNAAKAKDFAKADSLIAEANSLLNEAHKVQTQMIQEEASGQEHDLGFIMIHAQDHVMGAILLRDLMQHFIELYKAS